MTLTGLQFRKSICDIRPLDVGFVVNKLTVGQVFFRVVQLFIVSVISYFIKSPYIFDRLLLSNTIAATHTFVK